MRTKYFIRAAFYYGNYDHLSRPPTFNLEFDGNKWTTVAYRYNYGAGSDQDLENWIIGFPVDEYNRVWKPFNPPGTNAVKSDVFGFDSTSVNLPPNIAIILAIEANNPLDAIELSFPLNKASNRNYVAAYFTEISDLVNDSRFIDFYHDDTHMGTLPPEYGKCTGVWAIIQSTDNLNIQLRQNASSALPPVISAIEVYTASDPLITSTSQDDSK
ncbi:hypothetical protein NL676_031613 [Syzygium grande]|nr:hypothetical protein NL676_031613 [Syzygium grande]